MQQPVTPAEPRLSVVPNVDEAAQFPRIPGYRFLRRLGQGGMATVFLATQESLDRPVSIKVMERDALQDEVSKQRFEHEAQTIAKLTHPSIVNIYEVGRTGDGRMYYIMPYLANGDLSQRDLRNDEGRILDVLRTLLSALDYAHARGIVHRDVKEENVLFDVADRPLLTDFGIALSKRDTSRITSAGLAVGSSGYMAPEQARGDEVDGRADLYSVGVLAYELLTGRLPYQSPDALALALMHAQKAIPRLPPAKRHWQGFIDRAMAKSPDQRFRDAQQMAQALDRIGRRTGNQFSGRVLRRLDHAVDVKIWKQPGLLGLLGALLLVIGLYSARDQLPSFGASPASTKAEPVAVAVAANVAENPSIPADAPATTHAAALPATLPATAPEPATAAPAAPPPPTAATVQPTQLQSPPAIVAASATATASIAPDAAVLGAARDAITHANLTAPAGNNAGDLTLMAWKLSPATRETKQLAADVLTAMSRQQALAIGQHHDQRVLDYQQKAQQLADATIGRSAPAWRTLHAAASAALDKRVQAESATTDSAAALRRSEALAKQLDLSDVYAKALASAQKKANAVPAVVPAIDVGAGFVLVPGPSNAKHVVALARTEVTRHEYAQFVNATRRPASTCADQKGAGPTATRKNWTEPGFDQTSEQTVVCVSWNDANAYAQWLSTKTGQHFRLASVADWHALSAAGAATGKAGVVGSFTEWLQNCAAACQRHLVAGRAWREHGTDTPAGLGSEHGFDDVGFRVVREIEGRN